jgi:hypothetical protein
VTPPAHEFPGMCDSSLSDGWKIGSPTTVGGNSVFLNKYFEDVDEIFDKAQNEGATVIMPLMDAFGGCRYGQLKAAKRRPRTLSGSAFDCLCRFNFVRWLIA